MKNGQERNIPWLTAEYFANREKFPPEELAKYAGKHIAWSWDGKTILASGATHQELEDQLCAKGVDPSRTVRDYVDPPESLVLGVFDFGVEA